MILGIDPGLANTGWAVLSNSKIKTKISKTNSVAGEQQFYLVAYGTIKTKVGDEGAERIGKIIREIRNIIRKFEIKKVGIEGIYFAKNAKSAIKVAEVIGAIKVASYEMGVEIKEVTPLQVKMALVGYGRAEKEQVEIMVRNFLGLEEIIRPSHAADAAAVALTVGFLKDF
ncbi:MAG: crossover junction endodeoxyribonuclease RuvC [Candidatus Shapirobacteria bacterium]|jgi:crossover junction endodeoxyribonuclease RuvC